MSDHRMSGGVTVGCSVYTMDGTHLGKVKEVQGNMFKVDAPMQPDYWLSSSQVSGSMGDGVSVSFNNGELDQYRMDGPDGDVDVVKMERGTARTETQTHTTGYATGETERGAGRDRSAHDHVEGERTLQLKEEQLRARKEQVEAGEVEIRKEVVSEQQTIDVPVRREEVYIERRPVSGDRPTDGVIGEGEDISVKVMEERVTVEKTPVVREEIAIGKRVVEDTERVTETVRHEEARIERDGLVEGREADPNMLPREGRQERERTF